MKYCLRNPERVEDLVHLGKRIDRMLTKRGLDNEEILAVSLLCVFRALIQTNLGFDECVGFFHDEFRRYIQSVYDAIPPNETKPV